MSRLFFILFSLCVVCPAALAQTAHSVVVADAVTRQPVAHASLVSRQKGQFRSAVTDRQGRAEVDFSFRKLDVTHLNYHRLTVSRLSDTLFLKPKDYQIKEVKVTNQEPEWIRPLLRRFVKGKDQRYASRPQTLRYDYQSSRIGAHTYYNYVASGLLSMRQPRRELYYLFPLSGTVESQTATQLTDVTNLRRMLYEDFVACFDRGFISDHVFAVNPDHQGPPNEVELFFRSKKKEQDHGHFLIDTTRLVILNATRTMDTEANKRYKVSAFNLSLAWVLSGYRITDWDVNYHSEYVQTDGVWHPSVVSYKFFFRSHERLHDKDEAEFRASTGSGFCNMEAQLQLNPLGQTVVTDSSGVVPNDSLALWLRRAEQGDTLSRWYRLPESWYVKMNSNSERRQEIRLARLPLGPRKTDAADGKK